MKFRKFFGSPYTKTVLAMLIGGSLLIIINRIIKSTNFSSVFSTINSTLTPFYIGILIAFLLCPIYNFLVRKTYHFLYRDGSLRTDAFGSQFFNVRVPKSYRKPAWQRALIRARVAATLVCIAIVAAIVVLISVFILPSVIGSVIDLVNSLPDKMAALEKWSEAELTDYPAVQEMIRRFTNLDTEEAVAWIEQHILENNFKSVAETISTSVIAMIQAFIDAFVGLLIAIYLLNYKDHLFAIGRKILSANMSEMRAKGIYQFARIINETFIGYIVGRIIDACIIGVLTYVTMSILNIPMPLLVSIIVGVTNVIPFFGPFLGAIPSAVLIVLEDPIKCLYFIVMILIIQQLDGNVIGPRIVGTAIGISSFWVLVAVLIGGGLFGFIGMALGVPVFAVIYRYMDMGTENRLSRKNRKTATMSYVNYSMYGIDPEETESSPKDPSTRDVR